MLIINNFNEEIDGKFYYIAKIIEYSHLSCNPLGELIKKLDEEIEEKNDINNFYESYLTEEEVEKGLKNKTLYEGLIHINPKNRNDSYVRVVNDQNDIRVCSVKYRNRALDNEIVIVKLLEGEEKTEAEAIIQKRKKENELKDKENYKKFFTKGLKLSDYIPEKCNLKK